MDLKHRAIQIWGYFAFIVGGSCAIILVVLSHFPTPPQSAGLFANHRPCCLPDLHRDSGDRIARHGREPRLEWRRIFSKLVKLSASISRSYSLKNRIGTVPLVALGIAQSIAGGLAFLYVGTVILAGAAYLGVGPGAIPALAFCLWGTVSGIALVVRRSVGSCRMAAIWNLLLGLFFLAAAFAGSHFSSGTSGSRCNVSCCIHRLDCANVAVS